MSWLDTQDQAQIEVALAQQRKAREADDYTATSTLSYANGDERFALWLSLVDRRAVRRIGVSVFDLADWCSRDAYDDGVSPSGALDMAMEGDDLYCHFGED